MSTQTDSLGRATFHHIAPQSDVVPTERELRWLKHIERHGPQSSQYLYELTRDTHRCKDTALRQMQKLRAGGYLMLPPQQRRTAKAEFNPYIYDLGMRARDHLRDLGLDEPTVRPQGHWWHSFAVAQVTSAIDIAAANDGVRYIPAHEILAIKGASLSILVGRQRLIPDQLFGLDYGGTYRVFALEVDRGTEPKTSPAARKSWASSIDLYRQVIEQQIWKSHYGLKANLLVLWVCARTGDVEKLLEMVGPMAPSVANAVLVQGVPEAGMAQIEKHKLSFYGSRWQRAREVPVRICSVS
ncbi:replication-relaxation family protein [Pseudoruegeria sp. HB172150]|uniref:replication-relaxation family protein n=1 Tax=Pseudoruegeria sp. HB172150 TaxID=2721164 RepID=UPI0015582D41|nr:replication-relaxation family protein [Pseudoruegeria sp. HB172150]